LRLELDELVALRAGHASELAPLRDEIAAVERQVADLRRAAIDGLEELAAGIREEEAALELAEDVVGRSARMHEEGLVSEVEHAKALFEVEKHKTGIERTRAAKERLESDRRAETSELEARIAERRRLEARLRGDVAVADATAARLEHEIERRTLRAPVSGRLGETASLRVGQHVAAGTRLAVIVPEGRLKVVAEFRPQDALGRIRSGQEARFRLRGFPWTQYGFVPVEVASLASETLAGSARVESSLAPGFEFPVALEHGWPGTLEIEVERVSPATLVLRAAGALLADRPGRVSTTATTAVER
jgi:membrane fusion protein (multidrug efflux system)